MATAIALAVLASIGLIVTLFGIFAPAKAFEINRYQIQDIIPRQRKSQFRRIFHRGALTTNIPLAIVFGLIFYFGTRWPVAGVFGLMVGWIAPEIVSGFTKGKRLIAEVEAWEEWTGQLLHLVQSGNAIPNSIVVSAKYAPEIIKDIIEECAREVETVGLIPALDHLIRRARSPYADQLALGLRVAYESGSRISEVFNDVKDALRNEVEVTKRAEAARQVANSQGILSIGVSFALVAAIVVINRGYLDPFNDLVGQIVLAVVAGLFTISVVTIRRFSIVAIRPRLLTEGDELDEFGELIEEEKEAEVEV